MTGRPPIAQAADNRLELGGCPAVEPTGRLSMTTPSGNPDRLTYGALLESGLSLPYASGSAIVRI